MIRPLMFRGLTTVAVTVFATTASAAVSPFTESFSSNASGWLNDDSGALDYVVSGGAEGDGYVSRTHQITTPTVPPMFGSPLELLFRGNASSNASGGAFVGDWLDAGVTALTLYIRHDASVSLDFYARLAGNGGAGASIAPGFTVAPNTWTQIVIPIVDSNPPFVTYRSSSFNGVFTDIQNLQFGVYVPDGIDESVTFDLDSVSIVPEPASIMALAAGTLVLGVRRRSVRG